MKKRENILNIKNLKLISIFLSLILCFNLSISNEEEVRKTEKEIETEIIHQVSDIKINKLDIDLSKKIYSSKYNLLKFHSNEENYIPFLNVKRYIFHCQLALKGCISNIF